LLQIVADRISGLSFQYRYGMAGWFWATAGTTLVIGFIAGRRRFFEDIPRHLPIIPYGKAPAMLAPAGPPPAAIPRGEFA
jgi:hypothetical protein